MSTTEQLRVLTIHLREMGWVEPDLAEHYAKQILLILEPLIQRENRRFAEELKLKVDNLYVHPENPEKSEGIWLCHPRDLLEIIDQQIAALTSKS